MVGGLVRLERLTNNQRSLKQIEAENEMAQKQGLLSDGWSRMAHNKRYIFWFYVLNVALAWFGAGAFNNQVHSILDHSLRADYLLHGFHIATVLEMFARPEFGPTMASVAPAMHFVVFYFLLTALFLPGVLQGYAATYRLPREEFFRACGRNLWRFVRLLIVAAIVMGIVAGILFALQGALQKKAAESTNELLLPEIRFIGLLVIFVCMTVLRIWFDLAQADVVLGDQNAIRKSIAVTFRHMRKNLGRLLGSYLVTNIAAAMVLGFGIFVWAKFVPSASVLGAVLVSQLTLLLLLIPRFWQRGMAVAYYLRDMEEPIAIEPLTPALIVEPVESQPIVSEPIVPPVIPVPPPEPLGA
jgi:hypothetical protein